MNWWKFRKYFLNLDILTSSLGGEADSVIYKLFFVYKRKIDFDLKIAIKDPPPFRGLFNRHTSLEKRTLLFKKKIL